MREKRIWNFMAKVIVIFTVLLCSMLVLPDSKHAFAAKYSSGFDQKKAVDLQQQGAFQVSKQSIIMRADDTAGGVMITGNAADFADAVFSYGTSFDFALDKAEYLIVDALAERKKKIDIAFYWDDDSKPFATVNLAKQKKKEIWSTIKNRCVKLSGNSKIGIHKLRFKVITKETGNLQMVFRSVTFLKNDIPTVEFDLDETQGTIAEMNGDREHNTECYGKVTLIVPDGYQSEYSSLKFKTETYDLDYVRGRGNSTWSADKKPYKFKLEKKKNLLGMGGNKHWVLLANYYDVSMLRNKLTYWLGAQLGMEFTPKCEFVNVVMNGEYLGSYYLCEQIRVGESRVNIDDLEKDEETKKATDEATISGGYLLSMSPYGDELGQTFTTTQSNTFLIESPSFEGYLNEAQKNYIAGYVQNTEDAIYGFDFKDASGKSYQEYMDTDAAINYYWMQEISMNGDAFLSTSTYLYKKRNGKLYWGPLWDFDFVAWGATDFYSNNCTGFSANNSTWFRRLFDDPVFYQKVVERWPAFREKLLEASKDGGQIDIYAAKQYESQKHNYEIWKKYSNEYWEGDREETQEITYDSEVERFKSWIKERVNWIDDNLNHLRRQYFEVKFLVDNTEYSSVYVEENHAITEFPTEPIKEGYIFQGWYMEDKETGKETILDSGAEVTDNITVKAKWIDKESVVPVEQIAFFRDEYYLFKYDYMELKHCVLPFDAYAGDLKWESSDKEILTVTNNGYVESTEKTGDVIVTVTAPNGVKASCTVHVITYENYKDVESVKLEKEELELKAGEYDKINIIYQPEDAKVDNYQQMRFKSSDESVVRVNECGYIYGVKRGTAIVVCYCPYDNSISFCKITVK